MALEFEVSTMISASPQEIYAAWLDSERHAAMTGGAAHCSAEVGGSFDAWDGYIHGVNLALEPAKRPGVRLISASPIPTHRSS